MNKLYRFLFSVSLFIFYFFNVNAQGLKINELMSSNTSVIYDEDGDTPDWIEIINTGSNTINLSDYFLSDDLSELLKWQLPETDLLPGNLFLVLASGKDRNQLPKFWHTLIDLGQQWKYIIPAAEPANNWKTASFNDATWKTGASGIGYGDGDDNTEIPSGTVSVYMRKKFTITDL